MKVAFVLIPLLFLITCNSGRSSSVFKKDETKPDYDSFKRSVMKHKTTIKDSSSAIISGYLFELLDDDIFYYWEGTTWDFNGTSRKPKVGNIACGYFVTNTLADLDFDIQRVPLAQAVSSKMINTLCTGIQRFAGFEKLENYLKMQPDRSAYIIGLDFHTGYILKDSSGIYFMHSNYIDRQGVIKEKIASSKALNNSKSFMIGSLTGNKNLLLKWVRDQ